MLINCASLHTFCNEFQVKMYDIVTAQFSGPPDLRTDHQILRAGGPVVHCLKMLISRPAYLAPGITSTPTMRRLLRQFVNDDLASRAHMPINKLDRAYFPTSRDILNYIHSALVAGQ